MKNGILAFCLTALTTFAVNAQHTPPANAIALSAGNFMVNHTNKTGAKPVANDICKVQVQVFIGDSLMMDTRANNSAPTPIPFPDFAELRGSGRPVPVIFETLERCSEGDSATFYQKVDSNMVRQIPPNLRSHQWVRYAMKIVAIDTKEEQAKAQAESAAKFTVVDAQVKATIAQYNAGQLAGKLTATPSGLKVLIVEKGTGASHKQGEQVSAHYYGALVANGNMFDNSFQRGEPLPFALGIGQMITGFDEGAAMLNSGGKAYLFIPSTLGYGAQGTPDGSIPPNSELVFYIEMQ
jgi:FKBP-type peptidyl-prolyl cis-trans isomerase FkpA